MDRADEREPLVVLHLRLHEVTGRGSSAQVGAPVLVLARPGSGWEDLTWRSTVRAAGRLGPAEPGERPVAVLAPRGGPTVAEGPGRMLDAVEHVRERFRRSVQPLPADARGLVPGLVIGDTSMTPPDLTDDMRATGMTHLSAVSGSNVALVCGAVAVLVARTGVPRRWRTPLVLLALVAFVLLCRPEPSVLRAGVMGSVGLLALSSGRRRVSLPALGAAVVLLLCVDPWLARSYGFALSTLATLGLVLWSRPWGDALAAPLPARMRLLGDAVAVPLAAQVACAPVIVLLQGSIPVVAVLANLLAAPLVAPTTVLGVLAAVASPVSVALGTVVAWTGRAALPAWTIGRIARTGADVPYGTLDWVDGPTGAWLLTLLTVLALVTGPWWRDQLRRRPWWGWALLTAVGAALWPVPGWSTWPPPGWLLLGCDVGQGDAFLLRSGPGTAVLVDTGPDPDLVRRCLRDADVDRVELLVLSHFHADHVGGVPGVVDTVPVGAAYVSPVRQPPGVASATLAGLAAAGVRYEDGAAGQRLRVGEVELEVVGPGPRPVVGGSAANNGSLVLDVSVDGLRVLLTGDLEPEGARPLRDLLAGRDFDVLKVAHHGSSAQDERLVRATRAEVAVLGVGAENTFGHPAPSALDLLDDAGMVVLRTDTDGDLAVSREDGRLQVHRRDG
ncbi:ComEC/Rec2 family competence protein [Ornithinimicrobium sp. W1665]|uniref:ComEC/Rec2 family competence protein n=1 Tax=Ornithinimicrobium sp. W1665 TaxID=3416666 RepID=UPI003D6B8F5E